MVHISVNVVQAFDICFTDQQVVKTVPVNIAAGEGITKVGANLKINLCKKKPTSIKSSVVVMTWSPVTLFKLVRLAL